MKAFLAQKYNVLSQQQGTEYVSLPTCDQPGGLALYPTVMDDSEERLEKAKQGNLKKKGRRQAKEWKGNSDDALGGLRTRVTRHLFNHEYEANKCLFPADALKPFRCWLLFNLSAQVPDDELAYNCCGLRKNDKGH